MKPVISYYENGNIRIKEWFINGVRHRLDGPALITYYQNGNVKSEAWHIDGLFSRPNEAGPAVTTYFHNALPEVEEWFINGVRHRLDGPALITYYYQNGSVFSEDWFVNGKQIEPEDHTIAEPKTEEELLEAINKMVFIETDTGIVHVKKWIKENRKDFVEKYKVLI